MTPFAIFFSLLVLTVFWGGFAFLISYSLRLRKTNESADDEQSD